MASISHIAYAAVALGFGPQVKSVSARKAYQCDNDSESEHEEQLNGTTVQPEVSPDTGHVCQNCLATTDAEIRRKISSVLRTAKTNRRESVRLGKMADEMVRNTASAVQLSADCSKLEEMFSAVEFELVEKRRTGEVMQARLADSIRKLGEDIERESLWERSLRRVRGQILGDVECLRIDAGNLTDKVHRLEQDAVETPVPVVEWSESSEVSLQLVHFDRLKKQCAQKLRSLFVDLGEWGHRREALVDQCQAEYDAMTEMKKEQTSVFFRISYEENVSQLFQNHISEAEQEMNVAVAHRRRMALLRIMVSPFPIFASLVASAWWTWGVPSIVV